MSEVDEEPKKDTQKHSKFVTADALSYAQEDTGKVLSADEFTQIKMKFIPEAQIQLFLNE